MRPPKERSPWRWLLLIPAQLVIAALTVWAGVELDSAIFSKAAADGAVGHGVPIFSALLPLIALVVTVIVALVALIGLTVGLVRRARRKREDPPAAAPPREM